ncbi:MAG: hypothetical protein V3U58_04195 [Thermodesulfobacteriota bacterium]
MNKIHDDPDAEKYASMIEVGKALNNLTDVEYKKLMIIAEFYWTRRNLQALWGDAEDLLHEAVLSTLRSDKPKRWRRGVSIIKHLDQAMRNISGHWVRKGCNETEGIEKLYEEKKEENIVVAQLVAKETLEIIKNFFNGDEIAFQVLECRRLKGMVESEVCQELGIGHTEYETICKRIRRKLLKFKNQEVSNAK